MLCNAVGGGRVSDFPEKSITKMHGSTLLTLRGGGCVCVKFPEKKHYVTLEWPLMHSFILQRFDLDSGVCTK